METHLAFPYPLQGGARTLRRHRFARQLSCVLRLWATNLLGTFSESTVGDFVRTRVWAEGRRVVFVAEAKGGEEQEGASRMVIGNAYVELDRDAELAVPRPVARL